MTVATAPSAISADPGGMDDAPGSEGRPAPAPGPSVRPLAPSVRPRPGRPASLVAIGLAAALAAVTVGWWWATTGPVDSLASALTQAGRLSGLAASVSFVCLVLAAARIGPLDRAVGSERLYQWHGRLGRYAVSMVGAHVVLVTAGYMVAGGESLWSVIGSYLADPSLALAVVAAAVLLAVGVTSAVAVRRRLPYEVWHAVHLATYAAILFGLVHQVSEGAQFVGHPVASALAVVAFVVPVAVLLVNRLVRPLARNARHRFTVAGVREETPGVFSVFISGRDLARLPAAAGQYLRVHAALPGLRWASNPYSFSAAPDGRGWRITVAAVGNHSRRLTQASPGTRLWLEGPLGGLTLDPRAVRPVLLVAGGTGAAPIRALAEAALTQRPNVPVVVVLRVKDVADALFTEEWAALTAWAGGRLAVHLRPGPRTAPGNSLDATALAAVAPWAAHADVLACGSPDLTAAVRAAARQLGATSVRTESFGW